MPPKRKKSAHRERQKLIAAVVLGVALFAILLWPAEEPSEATVADAAGKSGPAAAAPRRGRALGGSAAIAKARGAARPAAGAAGEAEHGGRAVPTTPLPRLDLHRIAAADPFVARAPEENLLQSVDSGAEEALATMPARASVRAVYRTSRGAAAIVDGQIIPVKDAKHWITTLQAADLQD